MGSTSTASTSRAPRRAAAIERIPEPEPTSSTRAGPPSAAPPASRPRSASDSSVARQSRVVGWRPGAERHPRVEREDHVVRLAAVAPPGRPDHDPPADPQHREVRLPRVRPVLLVDHAAGEFADGPQPEGLEVAQLALRPGDGGADGGGVQERQVRADQRRGAPGPPGRPAPPRPARTRAPRTSRRARRGTGSRRRPRRPRGPRRRPAPASRRACAAAAARSIPASGPAATTGPASRAARGPRRSRRPPSRTPRAARAGAWRAWSARRRWR